MIQQIKSTEETSFIKVLGGSPVNRVFDFLIENDRTSWTMVEIRDGAKVGYATLKIIIPKLLQNNLIKITKEIGKAKLYTTNQENPVVKRLYDLYNEINAFEIRRFKSN